MSRPFDRFRAPDADHAPARPPSAHRRRRCGLSTRLLAACLLVLAFAPATAPARAGPVAARPDPRRVEAARLMADALRVIKRLRLARGLPIDRAIDPNETGIIGDEFTPLTTTHGDVEMKRTSANPAFAAALVRYLDEAGLRPGDVVAVGASGSFPSFVLATLCAARVLRLEPVVVYSIGASMYGANLPGFTFVEMLDGLRAEGTLPYRIGAVSAGGRNDSGKGVLFDEDGESLAEEARRTGLPLIAEGSLLASIRRRLAVYEEASAGRPIRCFVNIGGAGANYGTTEASLKLPPGLVRHPPTIPSDPTRGLVFEFAARGIPVVHLLFVKGLARENGLPYDPVPFPPIGEGVVYSMR